MLSHMNRIDQYIFPSCFVWDAKHSFQHNIVAFWKSCTQSWSSTSCRSKAFE